MTAQQHTAPKSVFVAATAVLFVLSLSAADSVGFIPTALEFETEVRDTVALSNLPELGPATSTAPVAPAAQTALPERIVIPAIGLDLPIQNPESTNIAALDELLKEGPARYVESAALGEAGTMIVFAHSSNLPVVRNAMYKAFNKIPELEAGDTITLKADGKSYLYSVQRVTKVNAEDTQINMSPSLGTRLVLVTCDTLTSKSSRFLLEAEFIGAYDL